MNRSTFSLTMSAEQFSDFYRGYASSVVVRSDSGISLAFPASALRQFVTRQGIQGRFEIIFDSENKLVSLTRIFSSE